MRLILCLSLLLFTACQKEPPARTAGPPSDAVATVGSSAILESDLDHALTHNGGRSRAETLQTLTDEEALAQLARAEGLAEDPSVRAAMRRMLAARLREKHSAEITVSTEEIRNTADGDLVPPVRVRQRLAFLRQKFSEAGGAEAAGAKLRVAREKFDALPPAPSRAGFGPLAVEYSDDNDTRYQGGDAGWIIRGERHVLLPAEVTAAAASVESPGLLPDVILSSDAAWLLLVAEVKAPSSPEVNSEQIRARLAAATSAAREKSLLEKARTAAPVKVLIPIPAEPVPASPGKIIPPANP